MSTPLYRFKGWLAAAAIAAAASWMSGMPEPAATLVQPVRRDEWKLDNMPRRPDSVATAASAGAAPYWGLAPAAAASAAAAQAVRWRIAGVLGHGAGKGVLVSYPDAPETPPRLFRVGEAFPNGDVILKIEERELQVREGKTVRTRLIEPLAPTQ